MIVQGYRFKFLSSDALQEAGRTLLLALLAWWPSTLRAASIGWR